MKIGKKIVYEIFFMKIILKIWKEIYGMEISVRRCLYWGIRVIIWVIGNFGFFNVII